jgi:glycosyltransferase involved in cell wall biosynthesis
MRTRGIWKAYRIETGAEQATIDLASGLRETGRIDVSATLIQEIRLVPHSDGVRQAFTRAGIPTTSFPTRRPFSWKLVRAIRKHIVDQEVDCVHVVGYKAAVHGGLAARFGRICPWVSTVHGWLDRANLRERFYAWTEVQMLRRAQRVIVLSSFYQRRLLERGFVASKLAWIPSGLRLQELNIDPSDRASSLPSVTPTIGILGRLSWEKNHAMFLQVARRILDCGCLAKFLIAGEGCERPAIKRRISELGLEPHVEMAGIMDRREFFGQVDILLICSRIENLPYVILEAMAWLCPVVATSVGGTPEMIESEETGLLVEDQDVGAMVTAVLRLTKNSEFSRGLAEAAWKRLQSDYCAAQSAETHLELYRELLTA